MKSGSLDMAYDMKQENIAPFRDGGEYANKFNVYAFAQKFIYFLNCNCSENAVTGDVNLRKAIYYAIDQDGMMTALGDGYQRLYAYAIDYYSDYSMVDWQSLDNYNTKTGADLAKSKEFLDQSSYNGEALTLVCMNSVTV